MIEDMIAALTHIRARQMLGHTPKRGRRKGRRPGYALTGHAPALEEIERRFERALQRLDAVERHSAHLVVKLARLLTNAVSQLQRPPHPAGPSSTTTTIFRRVRQKSSAASPRAGQRIRAPPWLGRIPRKQTRPQPAGLACENATLCPAPIQLPPLLHLSGGRTRRMDFPVKFWSIAPTLFHELKSAE